MDIIPHVLVLSFLVCSSLNELYLVRKREAFSVQKRELQNSNHLVQWLECWTSSLSFSRVLLHVQICNYPYI
jgi:hypothetical protein